MVGRREEKLQELGKNISETYGVDHMVIRADFAQSDCTDKIFEATKDLDMGFMSYVACFHTFGKLQDTPWEKHEQMINVNVMTFLKCFYHYMGIFAKQDRGAVINVSSLTAISSSPYNAQYGAGKSYIKKLTEAVAAECESTNVDVEVITLGTTITPSLLSNLPGGPAGEAVMKAAMTPEACVEEAFDNLGKSLSVIAGEHNKANVHNWQANKQMMNISVIWVPSILTTKILENSRYKKEMKVIAVDVKLLTAITFAIFFWIVLSVIGQA